MIMNAQRVTSSVDADDLVGNPINQQKPPLGFVEAGCGCVPF
jgi:hypothetical protein